MTSNGLTPTKTRCLVVLALTALWSSLALGTASPPENIHEGVMRTQVPFVENQGQVDDQVAYYAQTFAGTVFVTRQGEIVTAVQGQSASESDPSPGGVAIWERLLDGSTADVQGEEPTDIAVNYFQSANQADWKSNVLNYSWVTLGEVYPGVDAKLRAYGNNVEKLFYIAPGADPSVVRLQFEGIESLFLSSDGELILHTSLGDVAYTAPVAWQDINGHRVDVPVSYDVNADDLTYGFSLAAFDPNHELVIDPLLAATLVGGSFHDRVTDIEIANGSVYAAGHTFSTDFPTTPGVFDSTLSGPDGQFLISRFDMGLTTLQASTYIGLPGDPLGAFPFGTISIDSYAGDIFLAYRTSSAVNPTLSNSYDQLRSGPTDAFIARLSGDLTTLVGSTYFGGSLTESVNALEVNATNGNVCIAGATDSTNLPVTAGAHDLTYNNNLDAYVSCLSSDLSTLVASTYLGTPGVDRARAITTNGGAILVGGSTTGPSTFPTPNGAFQTPGGGARDGFVVLFTSSMQLLSGTFVGGADHDDGVDHLLLHNGSVYAAGQISNPVGFPVGGGFDTGHNGGLDGYVVRFNGFLDTFQSGTFLGGADDDYVRDLAVDSDHFIYVYGLTLSSNFPVSFNAFQTEKFDDSSSLTLSRLDASLGLLQYSSYLRGATTAISGNAYQIAVPAVKSVYLAGFTYPSYITTADAYQTSTIGAGANSVITHLSLESLSSELSMGFLPISTPESVGTLSIEVTRSGSTVGLVEVYVEYADGLAVDGVDYNTGQTRLTWEPGDGTSKFVDIDIVNDDFDEGDEEFLVGLTLPAGATVAPFGGGREVTIIDDDTAGVSVLPPQPDGMLTEVPDTATLGIALTSEPENGPVFITAFSDDTTAGTLDGADTNGEVQLVFDSANWDVVQTLSIDSVNDDVDDGDQPFQVDFGQILNPDPNYNGIIPPSADFVTLDDDNAGVDVQSMNMPLITSEAGDSDSLSYRLTSEPLASVQINLSPDADGMDEGFLTPPSLTFTPMNWDTFQPVTVTGLDDMIVDGDIQYQILSEGLSNDPLYAFGLTSFGPLVINQDDDAVPVDLTVSIDDGATQMFPFIPSTYIINVANRTAVPINGVQLITTSALLDTATMSWTCQAVGMSVCGTPSGMGNINTTVDFEPNGEVNFEVTASAVNQPFEQAVLTAEAFVPFGTTDTNPSDNFAMDSNLIFVFIVFKDSFESP